MLWIFSFALDTETHKVTFAGNVEPGVALQILQSVVVNILVEKAKKDEQCELVKEVTSGEGNP